MAGISGKTHLLFGAFFLLAVISAGATLWGSAAQSSDALVINLAGRQRMLAQNMTWLARERSDGPALADTLSRFEHTLLALRDGGPALDARSRTVTLPPAPDAALRELIDQAIQSSEIFRARLDAVRARNPSDPARAAQIEQLQAQSLRMQGQLDDIVGEFERRAEAKLTRLYWIQAGFLVTALALLVWGYRLTRRRIVAPIATLRAAAQRIGSGDLATPVPALRDDELGDLARALEAMRGELAATRSTLERAVSRRTRELAAAFEFSQEIVAQLDPERLLRSVVERAKALVHADAAFLCLLQPGGEALSLAAHSGGADVQLGLGQPAVRGPAADVIGAGRTTIVEAACSDCRFLLAQGAGHCLATPVRVGDQMHGALCVVRKEGATFDPHEERALSLLSNSAAIAMTNAQLVAAGQREAERTAALAERERLAAELHDSLAQTLSYVRLKSEQLRTHVETDRKDSALDELARITGVLETAYRQVRAALHGLRQAPPSGQDLAHRLAACADEFRELSGLPIEVTIQDPAALALPPLVQVQITHIVRAALSNVHRHAQASRVTIWAGMEQAAACFRVEDDGAGFDRSTVEGGDHLGMAIMHTRAERSGGQLIVESAPNHGTRVTARFPIGQHTA